MITSSAYSPPTFRAPIDLQLSRNEGRAPRDLSSPGSDSVPVSSYPEVSELRDELARRFSLPGSRVLIAAGGDDVLFRTCLATLEPGCTALVATPTFEMIPRYVNIAGGELREVSWEEGPFPTEAFIRAAGRDTAVAFVVTPNNPTGAVATAEDVERIARAMPNTLVVLDAAYGEFAEADPTASVMDLDNVVVVRTLSKAWGLAGLRVGYALGSEEWIARLGACGNPYPVSAASVSIAMRRLSTGEEDVRDYLARAKVEREELSKLLEDLGAHPARPTEANFVLARGLDPAWMTSASASLGIAIRAFPDRKELEDAVRITVPGDEASFSRLKHTISSALAPEAILFDLDGVLADVSRSYGAAIIATAQEYGVRIETSDIDNAKARGGANDDWDLTRRLLEERGVRAPLAEVTERFERLYQGSGDGNGLRETETALVEPKVLRAWGDRFRLGVVTGRPREDALRFLERFDLLNAFEVLVCREDAPLKPDPSPVRLALQKLDVKRAWMLGDTRDDLDAARGAGVIPIGVIPPGSSPQQTRSALERAGAARVLENTTDLQELLP